MASWHYDSIDLCKPAPAACPGRNCATRRIELAIETLRTSKGKSKQDRAAQLKALRVLVHLVGDIHQPLHAAENGDRGGNFVTVSNRKCFAFNKETQMNETVNCKLHSYWDNSLVKRAMGKQSEAQFALELSKRQVSVDGGAAAWAMESNALARSKAHTYEKFACAAGEKHAMVRLPDGYDGVAAAMVGDQLARAGQRLAAILNDIYR